MPDVTPAGDPSLTPSQDAGSMASLLGAVARTGHAALAEDTIVADQYRIVRPIGEGGMGVVYLARDTRLGRDVAVKLCTGLSASAVHRIQREAMALAKLAHPNVVVVYQAGEIDHRFFIAMEHVAGGTVAAWLAAERRSVSEIVALYAAAGDGLAAAHDAGLVHRDFKPDNVLVGGDGRPRVADFGLARAIEDAETAEDDVASASAPAHGRTQAGAVMGTLAYMAPEQFAGAVVDARADQFAFAVSLWEALFAMRPTRADTVLVAEGQTRPTTPERPSGDTVPRHIVAALQRALADDRAERWPDMSALLAELRRDPAAKRRRTLAIVGSLALVAAGATVASFVAPDEQCTDAPEQIEAVWNPERSTTLAAAIGDTAWPAIEERVAARVDAWIEQHRSACRATRVDGSASEDVLDQRMLCLDGRKREIEAILRVLEQGTATAISNAATAIETLPSSADCLRALPFGTEKLPSDPALREQIAEAQGAVAEVGARALDPSALDALAQAERAVELARAAGWRPVLADALATQGTVLSELLQRREALAAYDEAQHVALVAGADMLAVQILADQAALLADLDRFAEAQQAIDTAYALWERTGSGAYAGQRLLIAVANVAWHDERNEDALTATLQQVELATEAFGPNSTSLASNQFNLSIAYQRVGRHAEAEEAIVRAIEIARAAFGDDHPTVAKYIVLQATHARAGGDLTRAAELAKQALAIQERWFGPDDPRLLIAVNVLGDAARRRGDLEQAEAHITRALELRRRNDPSSPDVAEEEANLAMLAVEQGDFASAAPRAAAALATLEQAYGPETREVIKALLLTGYIAREQPTPDLEASLRDLTRAHGLAVTKLGPDDPETINLEVEIANTLIAQARAHRAVELLEERLQTLPQLELPVQIPPELRLTMARALVASGDAERACTLGREAEAEFVRIDLPPMIANASKWVAKHCD